MGVLLDKLAEKKILVSDGAWGTELQARGLTPDDCPEEWNISHAQQVASIAEAYISAGSDMVLTNTFGGSRIKLEKKHQADRAEEFNAAGGRNSLHAAAGTDAIVAGSVGPTGEFIQPLGLMSEDEMQAVFAEQIKALLDVGLRVICVETMMAVEEAACAIRAAKSLDPAVDVIATMTFDDTPNGFRTMMGIDPSGAVEALTAAGADVLGSNCGNGIEAMVKIAAEFRRHTDKPVLIHANAGLPELIDGKTVFRQSPQDLAAYIESVISAGANIVGGCCGTGPEHIRAIRAVVDGLLT
ncbi:MAG: methionine synthase [Planctomycetota bacterium]|nr:MAG: methionine synthase [Planctomycetota bacterium]